MATLQTPRTNWHLVIWPILALWVAVSIYVFATDWRDSAAVVLPILMAAAAFLVFLLNAIAGSVNQRRYQLASLAQSISRCTTCGRSDGPLQLVDYHWYLFLGAIVVQFGQPGKFCPACARARLDQMFRRTLWGSLLCPPIILWSWLQRRRILQRIQLPPLT